MNLKRSLTAFATARTIELSAFPVNSVHLCRLSIASAATANGTTSKGGVRLLTKALAIELSPLGIRVNAIGPGFTATPLNAKAREDRTYMANFESRIPLGRIGTPEDIAGPAVFLASDMARYITGVTLPVDGGYLAR